MRQLFVGLIAEGNTDVRFLKTIIYNSVLDLSWECDCQFDLSDIRVVKAEGDSFTQKMLTASKKASSELGISLLCIHADSDHRTIQTVMETKFDPFLRALEEKSESDYCKVIVPTIPVQMIESWMLSDKILFKELINASSFRDIDLGIEKHPESYSDPKSIIENAIRISMDHQPKKRRDQISISDLYDLLSNRLCLDNLRTLSSFIEFENQIKRAFRLMGLMR